MPKPKPEELPKRKDNSLERIATKILLHLPENPASAEIWEVSVPDLNKFFKVGNVGRIYEILNILESLLLVTKVGREIYRWNGTAHLPKTLAFLKVIGEKLQVIEELAKAKELKRKKLIKDGKVQNELLMQYIADADYENDDDDDDDDDDDEGNDEPDLSNFDHEEEVVETSDEPGPSNPPSRTDELATAPCSKADKMHRLEVCQKFVMLFLTSKPPRTMALKDCAEAIFLSSHKSATRRLYDLANVLTVLPTPILKLVSIITDQGKTRAYQYCGPDVSNEPLTEDDIYRLPDFRKENTVFNWGRNALGLPPRPNGLPGFQTVRVKQGPVPCPTQENKDLFLSSTAIEQIKRPFTPDEILLMESKHRHFRIISNPEIDMDSVIELKGPNGEQLFSKLEFAILRGQKSFEECFSPQDNH